MVRQHFMTALGVVAGLAVALAMTLVAVDPPRAVGAPTLPTGFVLQDTPSGQGTGNLTDFGYLPDGTVLTIGKNGRVTWLPPVGAPRTIARLTTDSSGDYGLVGLAIAPDYLLSGHVYLIRALPDAAPTYLLRLSRFTVVGGSSPTGLTDEKVVLEVDAATHYHGMTTVLAEPDDTLWVSIGDTQTFTAADPASLKAMDPAQPFGKVLHVTTDGAGVPTNPYYDPAHPSSWRSRVYASGFRSPFRMSLNPATGTPIVGDVGWSTWEEVDLAAPGQNYRWPCWEGPAATPGFTDLAACANVLNTPPLWSYHHGTSSNQGNSVTGGIVYSGTSYPAAYQGAYFFGDYAKRKLWTMRFDATGKLVKAPQDPPFATDIGGPVKFAAAPNGDIVFADIVSGLLRRLSYSPGNHAPVAKASTTTDPDTRTVTFDGSGSLDFDGDALTYRWDFGDGATGQGVTVRHTYAGTGTSFDATLTVTDPLRASGSVPITVAPSNHAPVLDLSTPGDVTFAVGDPVSLSATAGDAEDGPLDVQWTTAEVHCPEATTCHLHPGSGSTGPSLELGFTDHPDTHMEITATVADSAGVEVSKTYEALPRLHRLTLVSDTPAVLETLGWSGGTSALVTEGASVEVVAAAVALDGVATFNGWQDGTAERTRTVPIGTQDITLTATYLTPIARRYQGDPALRALLGAPTGPEIAQGAVHYRDYQRGRLYSSAATGVHEVHGAIWAKYRGSGGQAALGVPVTDETGTGDGVGRYNDFSAGWSIYWTPTTGSRGISGAVRRLWRALGAEDGVLGYAVTDQRKNAGSGRHVDFAKHAGSVYWSRTTGAHEVYGAIARRWKALGADRSSLGLPTTGVVTVPGGLRSGFQHGWIRWYAATGKVVVHRG